MVDEIDDVVEHYESLDCGEDGRLRSGAGLIEFERTKEIINRYLPTDPSRVLDIGGATGVYSEWLLGLGHTVHLVDLSPRQVALASDRLAGPRFVAEVGDARALPVAEDSFDAALVLGPLYHLPERIDRVAALRDARRSVRPGGFVFAAAINRYASLFDGLTRGFLRLPEFGAIVEEDLRTGQHRNPSRHPEFFTTAYFHRPDELAAEVRESGLELVAVLGVEGMTGWIGDLDDWWADSQNRAVLLDAARTTEAVPELLGLSSHLLAVARV